MIESRKLFGLFTLLVLCSGMQWGCLNATDEVKTSYLSGDLMDLDPKNPQSAGWVLLQYHHGPNVVDPAISAGMPSYSGLGMFLSAPVRNLVYGLGNEGNCQIENKGPIDASARDAGEFLFIETNFSAVFSADPKDQAVKNVKLILPLRRFYRPGFLTQYLSPGEDFNNDGFLDYDPTLPALAYMDESWRQQYGSLLDPKLLALASTDGKVPTAVIADESFGPADPNIYLPNDFYRFDSTYQVQTRLLHATSLQKRLEERIKMFSIEVPEVSQSMDENVCKQYFFCIENEDHLVMKEDLEKELVKPYSSAQKKSIQQELDNLLAKYGAEIEKAAKDRATFHAALNAFDFTDFSQKNDRLINHRGEEAVIQGPAEDGSGQYLYHLNIVHRRDKDGNMLAQGLNLNDDDLDATRSAKLQQEFIRLRNEQDLGSLDSATADRQKSEIRLQLYNEVRAEMNLYAKFVWQGIQLFTDLQAKVPQVSDWDQDGDIDSEDRYVTLLKKYHFLARYYPHGGPTQAGFPENSYVDQNEPAPNNPFLRTPTEARVELPGFDQFGADTTPRQGILNSYVVIDRNHLEDLELQWRFMDWIDQYDPTKGEQTRTYFEHLSTAERGLDRYKALWNQYQQGLITPAANPATYNELMILRSLEREIALYPQVEIDLQIQDESSGNPVADFICHAENKGFHTIDRDMLREIPTGSGIISVNRHRLQRFILPNQDPIIFEGVYSHSTKLYVVDEPIYNIAVGQITIKPRGMKEVPGEGNDTQLEFQEAGTWVEPIGNTLELSLSDASLQQVQLVALGSYPIMLSFNQADQDQIYYLERMLAETVVTFDNALPAEVADRARELQEFIQVVNWNGVSFRSYDPYVASISKMGEVQAVAPGNTLITLRYEDGLSGEVYTKDLPVHVAP
jgi:hypothetical protein